MANRRSKGVRAVAVSDIATLRKAWSQGCIAVAVDPRWTLIKTLQPDVCVDAIIAKGNLGTTLSDAPLVIGLGPGFRAPHDVHMVIETQRGHDLGRIIPDGGATPNTGIPGDIDGFTHQRVIKATTKGTFHTRLSIGASVVRGDTIGRVGDRPLTAQIDGCIRGLLPDGTPVNQGCKLGDIDPRGDPGYCATISDKARAISGSVLEAILRAYPTFEVNSRLGVMNDARHS